MRLYLFYERRQDQRSLPAESRNLRIEKPLVSHKLQRFLLDEESGIDDARHPAEGSVELEDSARRRWKGCRPFGIRERPRKTIAVLHRPKTAFLKNTLNQAVVVERDNNVARFDV